jgi:hypothetical protein
MRIFAQPRKRASPNPAGSRMAAARPVPSVLPSPSLAGRQAVQRILHPHAGERVAGAAVSLGEAPSVLRRAKATAKTAAGEYVADPYETNWVQGAGGITTGYGAKIKITFKANENVDAEKIALVQTARSVMDGRVQNIYDKREMGKEESKEREKERKVNASRMIRSGATKAGTHIDQLPRIRTPLYGIPEHRGDALSQPEPSTISTIGCHYKDSQGRLVQNQDASLFDTPDLNSGDIYIEASKAMKKGWSQTFETSAVAIEGRQKGTYYGSVAWGW